VYSSQQFVCDFGFLDGRLTADETAVSYESVLDATLHGQQGEARPCRVGELRPNVLAKVIDRRLAVCADYAQRTRISFQPQGAVFRRV